VCYTGSDFEISLNPSTVSARVLVDPLICKGIVAENSEIVADSYYVRYFEVIYNISFSTLDLFFE